MGGKKKPKLVIYSGSIVLTIVILVILATEFFRRGSDSCLWVGSELSETAYSGSQNCRPCHERFYQLWAPSHHGLAMQPFNSEHVQQDLVPHNESIEIDGSTYRAVVKEGLGWIYETTPDGKEINYSIEHALGGKNLYYFLTPMKRGRLQVLPLAFDVRKKEWYNTTASMVRHFNDASDESLDWRELPLTFNTSCFNCHVSQLATNYSLETDSYQTEWGEPGINCESCHGPCEAHIQVCQESPEGIAPDSLKVIRTTQFNVAETNSLCAPCHAKGQPFSVSFEPGDRFFDHFGLVTLEDQDFYPDGRDLGENYTYTLWLMSPCVKSGLLDCIHCHTSTEAPRSH